MDNKNTPKYGDPNAIYFQEMKKLKQARLEWLQKHNVKSEKEWYEKEYLAARKDYGPKSA